MTLPFSSPRSSRFRAQPFVRRSNPIQRFLFFLPSFFPRYSTLWQSNYHTYSALSARYQKFLDGLTGHNDAYRFRDQARSNGYKLRTEPRGHPDNSGDEFRANHPIVRTKQVTGQKGIYANPTFTTRINELGEDESKSVLDYLFKLQAESHGTSRVFFPDPYWVHRLL